MQSFTVHSLFVALPGKFPNRFQKWFGQSLKAKALKAGVTITHTVIVQEKKNKRVLCYPNSFRQEAEGLLIRFLQRHHTKLTKKINGKRT